MKQDPIAISYARALLQLADERGELDAVLEETQFVRRLLRTDADFKNFVLSPGIDGSSKKRTLETIFGGGDMTATVLDFLLVVVDKGRALMLEDILEEYEDLYDVKMNRVHVDAITATPMSEERQTRLTNVLSQKLGKTILLENSADASILGGLVIRYGDLVVDGSVRSHIQELSARVGVHKLGSEYVHEN